MKSKAICFMVVQVVKRSDSGFLLEWYDMDQRATLKEAKMDLKKIKKDFPGPEYVIVERSVTEL